MTQRFSGAALAACLLLAVPATASAQTRELGSQGELLDRVAAIVNDGVVLQSELEDQMVLIAQRLRQQNVELPPQSVLRQQVLERLVVQEIQMQRARRAGIRINDETLNQALADVAGRNNLSLSDLPQALASQGIDYATYREGIRRELTLQVLRQRDVIQRINVSPREIEQYLDRQRGRPSEESEYDISHILIAVPQAATPQQLDEASRRAQEIYERATKGEDFSRLAIAYSSAQSALEGGALGWRKGPEIPTVLADLVIGLQPGAVSQPLRTPTGYHIVKLNALRGADQPTIVEQVRARHILLKPTEIQDDATVVQRLRSLRERALKGEDFAGLAQTVSEDPGSAAEGGDLGWNGPGTFVPEFEKAMIGLRDNEISEPVRTQFGWHIIQVLGRRQFDSSDEMRRQRAFAQLRESKADEETELWLRRLRDEAYVEFRM